MSDTTSNTCAITGAAGYLGSRVSAFFQENGWTVYEMTRKQKVTDTARMRFFPYSLKQSIDPSKLNGVSALVHCAYDFSAAKWPEIYETNVKGSLKLMESAAKAGVKKLVFISTMSAFDGCRSLYGKAKLMIEEEVLKLGGIVIRPGLIYGNQAGGMVGALNKMLSLSSVLPLVGFGGYPLYLIHESDLCRLIFDVSVNESKTISAPIIAAHESPRTFKTILQELATARGKKATLIPFPWQLMWTGLKTAEVVGVPLGFRSDSLLSLINQNQSPDFQATRQTGIAFREFDSSAALSAQ